MIIDLETQAWTGLAQLGTERNETPRRSDGEAVYLSDASPEAHERAMVCVDVSVVLGFRSEALGVHIPMEAVASFVRKSPSRRIGFVGVDPMTPDALAEIDRGVELGMGGVVMSPQSQNVHPTHSRAMRLYERCQALGLPVLISNAGPMTVRTVLEYGRPAGFDEVLRSFPALRMVIGHLGLPWIHETFAILAKHRNVYADLAGIASRPWGLYNALLAAMEAGVMDRLLFASNFPYDTPQAVIERIYSINTFTHGTQLPAIPRQFLRAIVERDALTCLGIVRPVSAGRGVAAGRAFSTGVESKRVDANASSSGRDALDDSLLGEEL